MLRKINENEFKQYIDFAYNLAMDMQMRLHRNSP